MQLLVRCSLLAIALVYYMRLEDEYRALLDSAISRAAGHGMAERYDMSIQVTLDTELNEYMENLQPPPHVARNQSLKVRRGVALVASMRLEGAARRRPCVT
jgi:hypothetical protein